MSKRRETSNHIEANSSKKLRINLRILSVVYTILFFVTIYSLIVSNAIFWQVIVAIIIGVAAGMLSARMYKISWDHGAAEVIGRIDIYGIIVLVAFIAFELNRGWIAELFADSSSIGSISLLLLTSALFGRIIATSRRILQVLNEQKVISKHSP